MSAAYRRGLDELVVTTRLRSLRPWTNPIGSVTPEGPFDGLPPGKQPFRWEAATVSAGAFAGARAERSTAAPFGQSQYWALNDELSLTIQASRSRRCTGFVESLRPI